MDFLKDKYGFWRQVDPVPIEYDQNYKDAQKTTPQMAWLRLGFLFAVLNKNINDFSTWKVCDVGSGNGCFIKEAKKVFGYACNYDLCGDSITQEELYSTPWDIIFLTDVLQHFEDINDLFKIHFKYLFISFPETPEVADWHILQEQGYRHFRPNEHIYMFNAEGMIKWMDEKGCVPLKQGNIEDALRKSFLKTNITTQIYRKW